MAKHKRKRKYNSKKRKESYERKAEERYTNMINNINDVLKSYFKTFSNSGLEYNKVALNIEKIFSQDFDFALENGNTVNEMKINTVLGERGIENKSLARSRITRAYKYVQTLENPQELGSRKYGTQDSDKIKLHSVISKLLSDTTPNYYAALVELENTDLDSPINIKAMKDKFSEFKDMKRGSDEWNELYEDLGNDVMEYLKGRETAEKRLLESYETIGKHTTIADILKNNS